MVWGEEVSVMICWLHSDAYGDIWPQKSETVRVAPPQSSTLHGHQGARLWGRGVSGKELTWFRQRDPGRPAP